MKNDSLKISLPGISHEDIKMFKKLTASPSWDVRLEINPSLMDLQNLKLCFEMCCDEYRRRLCEQWELDYSQSWWIPTDRVGECLALNDLEFSLSMADVRIFVERNISYDDFLEWWDAAVNDCPINAWSWFEKGARPEILNGNHEKD